MATCKDCLHYKICKAYADDVRGDAYNENELFDDCYGNFKNKSDFQEVKQGKWEDKWNGKFANPTYICSVCKESAALENYIDELFTQRQRQKLSLFCPSCGAKMGDDKNE